VTVPSVAVTTSLRVTIGIAEPVCQVGINHGTCIATKSESADTVPVVAGRVKSTVTVVVDLIAVFETTRASTVSGRTALKDLIDKSSFYMYSSTCKLA
jgi:hypothetical protein